MCRWVTMWGCNTNILSEWGRGGSYEKISGWRSESRAKTFLVHPNLTQSLGSLSRATVVPSPSSCFLFAVRGASWLFPTLRPTHGILSQGFLWILRRITNNLKPLFLIIFAARWMKRLKGLTVEKGHWFLRAILQTSSIVIFSIITEKRSSYLNKLLRCRGRQENM